MSCWRRPPPSHRPAARFRQTRRALHRPRDDPACPVTWPWNMVGWPSVNVPAGFTSDGLPIGVQLMGPANSEPMLGLAGRRTGGDQRRGRPSSHLVGTPRSREGRGGRTSQVRPDPRQSKVLAKSSAVRRRGSRRKCPAANADNRRLNESVVVNVYTVQHKAGCTTEIKINPKLRFVAQWHTNDVLSNRCAGR